MLYSTLRELTPEDEEGVQRAYIQEENNGFEATIVPPDSDSSLSLYGIEPTIIAKLDQPFQMIPRNHPEDILSNPSSMNVGILRKWLRNIVDEV